MYTVKKTPKTPNIIWDAKAGKPLCKFEKGIIITNDEVVVSRLKELGYEVEGEPEAKSLDDMIVKELQAFAADKGIDLGDAKKKEDILNTIKAAETQ